MSLWFRLFLVLPSFFSLYGNHTLHNIGVGNRQIILKSPEPDIEFEKHPAVAGGISRWFLDNAPAKGDKVAFVDGRTKEKLTYAELKSKSYTLAHTLVDKFKIKKGDTILVVSKNCIDYPVIVFGCLASGATISTCNPGYTVDEMKYQVEDCVPRFIICDPEAADGVLTIVKSGEFPLIEKVFMVGASTVAGTESFRELFSGEEKKDWPAVEFDMKKDLALLLYSSGTTGQSKGVMISHYGFVLNFLCSVSTSSAVSAMLTQEDVQLCILPFFHTFGLNMVLTGGIVQGTTVIFLPKFEPALFLQCLQDYGATTAFIVPPIAVFLAKHPSIDNFKFPKLKTLNCGAAPLSEETSKMVASRLNVVFRQGFGMTEIGCLGTIARVTDNVQSVGPLIRNLQARIVDEHGVDQGPNGMGELWIKTPSIMMGYWKNEKATKETINADGWMLTGDIGYYDEEGSIYIKDRSKELIKCKGFQVAPAELEAVLLNHVAVADCCVVGKPDERSGEIPIGFVVLQAGKQRSPEMAAELMAFVEKKVAVYKKLGDIEFVDSIPKNPSGKLLRRVIRQQKGNRASNLCFLSFVLPLSLCVCAVACLTRSTSHYVVFELCSHVHLCLCRLVGWGLLATEPPKTTSK